jgi:hypothetical protein
LFTISFGTCHVFQIDTYLQKHQFSWFNIKIHEFHHLANHGLAKSALCHIRDATRPFLP